MNRSVAATCTPERQRNIGFSLCRIARQKELDQAADPLKRLPIGGIAGDMFTHRRVTSRQRPHIVLPARLVPEAHRAHTPRVAGAASSKPSPPPPHLPRPTRMFFGQAVGHV